MFGATLQQGASLQRFVASSSNSLSLRICLQGFSYNIVVMVVLLNMPGDTAPPSSHPRSVLEHNDLTNAVSFCDIVRLKPCSQALPWERSLETKAKPVSTHAINSHPCLSLHGVSIGSVPVIIQR